MPTNVTNSYMTDIPKDRRVFFAALSQSVAHLRGPRLASRRFSAAASSKYASSPRTSAVGQKSRKR